MYLKLVLTTQNSLVNVPSGAQMWEDDGTHGDNSILWRKMRGC